MKTCKKQSLKTADSYYFDLHTWQMKCCKIFKNIAEVKNIPIDGHLMTYVDI